MLTWIVGGLQISENGTLKLFWPRHLKVGESTTIEFEIKNDHKYPVEIRSISGFTKDQIEVLQWPGEINPNETKTLKVKFTNIGKLPEKFSVETLIG